MHQVALSDSQKNVVRRYVEVWRRWRPGIRAFAELERDMENGSKVLVDGITIDERSELPVIAANARDHRFYAAVFNDDGDAIDDVTSEELDQLRRYVLYGSGVMPVRKWRRAKPKIDTAVFAGVSSAAQASYLTRAVKAGHVPFRYMRARHRFKNNVEPQLPPHHDLTSSRSQDADSQYSPSQDRRAEDGGTQNPERPASQAIRERHAATAVHGTNTGGVPVRGHAATGTAVGRALSQI